MTTLLFWSEADDLYYDYCDQDEFFLVKQSGLCPMVKPGKKYYQPIVSIFAMVPRYRVLFNSCVYVFDKI